MTEINDRSLLKCTIKKSADVLNKVVLYGSYVIAAITAIVIGTAIVYFGITKLWESIVNVISAAITTIWAVLSAIPWYVYVGGVAVMAIPVYSLLWCIARDLEKEDWESDSAKDIAALTLALAFALVALALVAFAFAAFALAAFALAAFALAAFALAAFALAAFALADPKIFLVIGAYLHYRKRTRELRQAGSP